MQSSSKRLLVWTNAIQVDFIPLFTYFIIMYYFDVCSFDERKNAAHQMKLKRIYLFKITLNYNFL